MNRRNTKKPHHASALRMVIESLETRAMLAGVGPESWSAPGIAPAPLGTGALFSSGVILTCSSPTPGSSGTASPPAPTSGSGTTSGGDLWLAYSAGSGAGGTTSGSDGGVSTDGPALSSQYNGGSGVGGQGNGTVGTLTNAELWRLYWSGAGTGSSSGPANGFLANDPTISAKSTGGSGGGLVFFVTGATGADAASSGSQQGSTGSTTLTLADGQSTVTTTPLVYQPGSDDGPGVVTAVWTGDDGGWQVVQAGDQQGNPPVATAPEKPSNWTRFWGVFDVIGGLGEAAVGGTGVVASGVGTVFSGGSAAPVSIPLLFGSSVVTLHGIDQAWAGVATVYWGTRQRPIAAQGLDTVTGNEMASDLLNGGAGVLMTGGVGLAVKGAGLGTRALSSSDDVGRAVGTTLDDGAKAAGTAARGAGGGAVGLKGVEFEDYIKRVMGGSGNFKAPNGRDIDGILPDGRWYEAKSAFNYLFQNGILDPKKWNEFTSQISSAAAESAKQGKPFVLLTNATPPAEVVAWLAKRGIPWELVK